MKKGRRSKSAEMFLKPRPGAFPVTKHQAAVSQLETAISLFFNNGDLISMCTLAYAAWTIIRNLNLNYKAQPAMDPKEYPGLVEDFERAFHDVFSAEANYFKHSGSDAGEPIYFDPTATLSIIMDSIYIHQQWQFPLNPTFETFTGWIQHTHPGGIGEGAYDARKKLASFKALFSPQRKVFFDKTFPVIVAEIAKRARRDSPPSKSSSNPSL